MHSASAQPNLVAVQTLDAVSLDPSMGQYIMGITTCTENNPTRFRVEQYSTGARSNKMNYQPRGRPKAAGRLATALGLQRYTIEVLTRAAN